MTGGVPRQYMRNCSTNHFVKFGKFQGLFSLWLGLRVCKGKVGEQSGEPVGEVHGAT